MRGVTTHAYATKTVARHWSASGLGVTAEGDGWLEEVMSLLLMAHGDKSDDHTGKEIAEEGASWKPFPAIGAHDAAWIRRIMKEEGFASEQCRNFRLHKSKPTFTSRAQHMGLNPLDVNVQGGWKHGTDQLMSHTYLREVQLTKSLHTQPWRKGAWTRQNEI